MKNTFKYIAAFVAFSAAILASGLSVSAQNLPEGTYMEENHIAYAKRANVNSDGTYTIELETFVTGEVTQSFEVHPADIVLVLDVSGSMDQTINEYVYTVYPHNNSITGGSNWNNNNVKDTNPVVYIKYNDEYYQVYRGRGGNNNNRHYFLFFTVNGTRYHITSSGSIQTEEPTNVTSSNSNLYPSGVDLYTRTTQSTGTTKMQALKAAVEAFIEQIAHNDWYEDDTDSKRRDEALGNRISIVKFGLPAYNGSTTFDANTHLTPGNHFADYDFYQGAAAVSNIRNYTDTYDGDNANVSEIVVGFTPTATAANVTTIKQAVTDLISEGSTAADYGMKLAYELISRLGSDRSDSRKTVVFFTDGEPNHGTGFTGSVATSAIGNSKDIKDITYTETYQEDGQTKTRTVHPSVFSVGLFATKPEANGNLENYMNRISSNYPNATTYTDGSKESSDYYMDASGGSAEDLKKIFTAIAHSAGGTGNADLSGGASVTVDVVSSSFSVPSGFEDHPENAVTVLVAPCNGETTIGGVKYLTFGEAKAPSEYNLSAITPSISESDNKVSTTGFDYATNWCGPDPTSSTGWHGYKQIIQFIINVNDDAVGGPAVETNDSESGIYLEGSTEPLLTFNRPTVKLPVQIWIQKQGLRPGDSAVLTLSKSPFVENFNPATATWTNFTKVVVSYDDMEVDDDGNPTGLVKIVGLDPDYYYRLKEDAWAFGYTYQYGGIQYTVGDNVQNPFIFVNVPKEVKYDEASLRNVFAEKTAASGGSEGGESGESGEGN